MTEVGDVFTVFVEIPKGSRKIEHFFQVYKDLEGHTVVTDGFQDRASALAVIEQARRRAPGP